MPRALDREALLAAVGHRVEVVTHDALYACCGHAWQARGGYEQTYTGVLTAVTESMVRVVAFGIGTVTYTVLVAIEDIDDARAL